jgi:hypothetical protein
LPAGEAGQNKIENNSPIINKELQKTEFNMRTKFTTVLTGIVAVIMLITTQTSRAAENNQVTKLTEIKNISKVTATGNVEVFLSQGATEGVTVYNKYYSENALVQLEDGELRITSYGTEKLQVWVQVDRLSSIEANGTAKIQSLNKITALNLSVKLDDSATAILNTETISSDAQVNGSSSLSLTGSAEDHALTISGTAKVDVSDFHTTSSSLHSAGEGKLVISRNGKSVIIQKV